MGGFMGNRGGTINLFFAGRVTGTELRGSATDNQPRPCTVQFELRRQG